MTLPNYLTVLRMFLTPVLAVTLVSERLNTSLYLFILAGLTDWFDGYLARRSNNVTAVGKMLDPLADKLLVTTVLGVFVAKGYFPLWMFLVILIRDVLITVLRQYALSKHQPLKTTRMAKWKTATQMTAIYFILIWRIAVVNVSESPVALSLLEQIERLNLVYALMLFVTLFTLASGLTYLVENRRLLKNLAVAFYRVFVPTNVS